MSLPFIAPASVHYVASAPERYRQNDGLLMVSWNVLLREDIELAKRNLCLWIYSIEDFCKEMQKPSFHDNVSKDELILLRNFATLLPKSALSAPFAAFVQSSLEKGASLESAIQDGIAFVKAPENGILELYQKSEQTIRTLQASETDQEIKGQYKAIADSLEQCWKDPETFLTAFAKNNLLPFKEDQNRLNLRLAGAIQRHPRDAQDDFPIKEYDLWPSRKMPLFEALDKVRSYAPDCPFVMTLQEVTPSMLKDFEEHFAPTGASLISYNNATKRDAHENVLLENEQKFREFLTSTMILSKELLVIGEPSLEALPTESGIQRNIMGVAVKNQVTGKTFAVFTTHSDHIPKNDLYERTANKIHDFVREFLKQHDLKDFVFGADLNAFAQMGGDQFIQKLGKEGPFAGAGDFRAAPSFHTPSEIKQATFLGKLIDDFRMYVGEDGTVEPNAVDHMFIQGMELVWGGREAAPYDKDTLKLIDQYKNPALLIEALKAYRTASDHMMQFALVRSTA